MHNKVKYIAKTFAGLEHIAAKELENLGATNIEVLKRAVSFYGNKELLYKTNYCCRTILRILQPIAEFEFNSNESFYKNIFNIPFENFLNPEGTFCIHSVISQSIFDNSQYTSLLAKDALCDRFRDIYNYRPSVDKENPDLSIDVHIYINKATISLDSSGVSLHRRGYKTSRHYAALNEVMAAGLISLSNWDSTCNLIDFMCGSGTILIEAAMYALNMPAGYYRNEGYSFMQWKDFDEQLWNNIRNEADNNIKEELPCKIYGSDVNHRFIKDCKMNIEALRLDDIITLSVDSFEETSPEETPSFVIINPPYGERLKIEEIELFYQAIANHLKKKYTNCTVGILTSNKQAMKNFGLHSSQKITIFNANLECCFYIFHIYKGSKKQSKQITK